MTQFARKSFSVAMNLGEKGRANWERIFGKKKKAASKRKHDWEQSPGYPRVARCTNCDDRAEFRLRNGEWFRFRKPRDFYCQAPPKKKAAR